MICLLDFLKYPIIFKIMLREILRYSEPLYRPQEISHGLYREWGTEPVRREDDSHVMLWWYPELNSYELNTDYGCIRFSREVSDFFNKREDKGKERFARASYRHGSIRATNRLQALAERVQSNLDAIKTLEKAEPKRKEPSVKSTHWLIEIFGEEVLQNRM
jgi:hypothetical protein